MMDNKEITNRLKRLRNKYKLIIINEDTFEEVVNFKLTRMSVYIGLSSLFVMMIIFTTSLIVFTPIKYYLPGSGYGNVKQIRTLKQLKLKTDSMQLALDQQAVFNDNLKKILSGKPIKLDTNKIKMPKLDNIDD
jgi:hypothetical protein